MAFDYDHTGNIALLDLPKVAFFASREVSPEQRRSALRWAEQTIRTGDAVISGFHSPLEAEILERLLAARHPVIWAHARTRRAQHPPCGSPCRAGAQLHRRLDGRAEPLRHQRLGRPPQLPRRHIRHGTHVGTGNTAAIGPPRLSKTYRQGPPYRQKRHSAHFNARYGEVFVRQFQYIWQYNANVDKIIRR